MSWKKYGGTNKLDKLNNISVNTIVTDKFTLKNFYVGDWDICGGLRTKDDAILMKDLTVDGDIYGAGNITIDGAMNVFNTNIIGNIFYRRRHDIVTRKLRRCCQTLYFAYKRWRV